jgi:hypothetical protein
MAKINGSQIVFLMVLAGFIAYGIMITVEKSIRHTKAVADCDCKNCDSGWWNE